MTHTTEQVLFVVFLFLAVCGLFFDAPGYRVAIASSIAALVVLGLSIGLI
jgi:hypothetical protein